MKILFEGYHYNADRLKKIITSKFYSRVSKKNNQVKINYVGYYCGEGEKSRIKEPVMIFPKVFLNEINGKPKAFGNFNPDDLIDSKNNNDFHSGSIRPPLIYSMSVWLYRAIDNYRKTYNNENLSELSNINPVISKKDNHSLTELEIIEALRLFYKENKNLFIFILKKSNSQKNIIKWNKTIAKKIPVFNNNRPIYFDVYSKKKSFDYDDELIRIFFSVLNNLNNKYGFNFKLNINYDLITGADYMKFEKKGYKYLKSIKYKYYSDKTLKLHKLLSLYFERISKNKVKHEQEEYVLIKDFNLVFEEMIDKLIGDPAEGEIRKMKIQPDNKKLDHIYKEEGLFQKSDIYFIADSKYYSTKSTLDAYSSYKQFTYARNVLALNIDIFNDAKFCKLHYQDKITEGYHPTPNFFISAYFDDTLSNRDPGLKREHIDNYDKRSSHWDNRLFDRDTLFTLSYRINFMFALQSFVRKNNSRITSFKRETRKAFRKEFIEFLDSHYYFYTLHPKIDFISAVDENFRLLLGVSFCPSTNKEELILAIEKSKKNGTLGKAHRNMSITDLKNKLNSNWYIKNTNLVEYERSNRYD